MKIKIGVISAWPEAETLYAHFADDANCTLFFRVGFMDEAARLADGLLRDEGVDAIITLGIPMDIFTLDMLPLIYPIYPGNYDILQALWAARELGSKPAFGEISFSSVRYDFDTICRMAGTEAVRYRFSSLRDHTHRESVEKVVRQMAADGRDVFVTMGGYSHQLARQAGIPSVPVMPEPQSFWATLETARRAYFSQLLEKEKAQWLNAVFDNAKEGVMVLDNQERVVVVNTLAQQFMHLDPDEIIGRPIGDVDSTNPLFQKFLHATDNFEVIQSRTRSYVVNREVLRAEGRPLGTVIRAHPVQELQKLEMSARRKISESGFTAAATFATIKGSSPAFEAVKRKAENYAGSLSSVILYGESGSGKELFAQSIHNASPCADGPFVAINCTVLAENLLESELFGYADGAFTGARKGGQPGLFELAHKGTLFLDEIGDMPLSVQAKLLRVIQERTVRRISGNRNIPVEVRLVFATHRDLKADVEAGRFRRDLYYRINVLVLHVPSLREHREDLAEISRDILGRLSARTGRQVTLSEESLRAMEKYDWPGNVRELTNFLERASFISFRDDGDIPGMLAELNAGDDTLPLPAAAEAGGMSVPLDTLHNIENAVIRTLYETQGWSRKKIETVLEISTSSLYRRMKEMGLT